MSDLKSAHVGHHGRKGRILAEFLKWLAAKVCLCFFKNAIQLLHKIYGQDKLRFQRYLTNVAIFEMS